MAAKRRPKKPKTTAVTLRGAKDVLKHLRVTHGIVWSRMTLYRRRTRPNDPLPGALLLIERRAIFCTTDAAVVRWIKRNMTITIEPRRDSED